MSKLESIVIVKNNRGYISHIRFDNPLYNEDISAESIYNMHNKIDYTLYKRGIR